MTYDKIRAQADRALRSGSPIAMGNALASIRAQASRGNFPAEANGPHTEGAVRFAGARGEGWYNTTPAGDRFLVLPSIPEVAPDTVADGIQLEFKGTPGTIVAISGSAVSFDSGGFNAGAEIQASIQFKLEINGGEVNLITNGQSDAFVSFATLFGKNRNYVPFLRHFQSTDRLTVTYRNRQPGTGVTIQPELVFWFQQDNLI